MKIYRNIYKYYTRGISPILFCLTAVLIITVCIVAVLGREALAEGTLWAVFVMTGSVLLCMLVTGIIWRQPESKTKLSFKVSSLAGL